RHAYRRPRATRVRCRCGADPVRNGVSRVQNRRTGHGRRNLAMSIVDIVARNVSKSYRVHHGRNNGLFRFRPAERFWALKDISFDVRRGEVLGVVGPNGSGKTTLIKLLARITSPDSGEITIAGRLMSLVEVGAGFHPELTGRDNVFLNATIFGVPVA